MRLLKIAKLVAVVLLISSCSQLTVTKINPGQEDGGLPYCLLVPKLLVSTKQALVYDKADYDQPPYSRAARPVTEQTVALVQVPSYDHYYTVKLKSGWFTSDSYSIGYDNNGCLNTYTFTTVDQTANVIATLGSIALAAAAVAAAEAPGVTYPEPSADTYLLDRSSRKLLDLAEAKLKDLQTRIQALLNKGTAMTPQDKQDLDKLRDELANILEKAAKLRSALEPTPTRIIKTEYANFFFIAESESADKYVVRLLQEAETGKVQNVIPRNQSGGQAADFVIGIARRIK